MLIKRPFATVKCVKRLTLPSESHGTKLLYSKACVKRSLSERPKIGFQDQLSLIAGHKYCRMLQGELRAEDSAMLSTFIKLPFVNKVFVLSFFSGRLHQGRGGGTLIFSYIPRLRPFLGFKILHFNIFGGVSENKIGV